MNDVPEWWALAFWVVVLYPLYSPRCYRLRKIHKQNKVSRNQTGKAWEQDELFPEIFEEDDL